MPTWNKQPLSHLPEVRVLGRTGPDRDPVTLFWTASGLEMNFTGSELWLQYRADYALYEPWISVELNGAWIARMPLPAGEGEVCLFRGLTPGDVKHVRVLKDVQAMHDDPRHLLQITALRYADGGFVPLPAPALRLEFVGDSITSGEGAIGAVCERDWVSVFFSAVNHYARLTADALGAEYRIVSQSGWGVVSGWDNDPRHVLPPYYEQVCGLAEGPANAAAGAKAPHDFAAWQPDAVMIHLGANDDAAFHNPPWPGAEGIAPFAQRLNGDDTPAAEDADRFVRAAADFLTVVRKNNPHALLVWCYGMLGGWLVPLLERAVERYRRKSGDERVFLLVLPDTTPDTLGAREHPGAGSHKAAATMLTEFLRSHLS